MELIPYIVALLTLSGATEAHPHIRDSVSYNETDAAGLVHQAVEAMGGAEVLSQISEYSFESNSIYRSQTLTQSYNLKHSDQSVAESGSQILSFSTGTNGTNGLKARTDRSYGYNDYWIWAFPSLTPNINYTVVMDDDGTNGFACFTKGQNSFFVEDPTQAIGFVDPYLTDYLVHQAHQSALPWFLSYLVSKASSLSLTQKVINAVTNETFPAVADSSLGLSLVVNSSSGLPYLVRSYEEHATFGHITSDLLLSNYKAVPMMSDANSNTSFLLPHRLQTVYNSEVIEDLIIDTILLNPQFASDFFAPLPRDQSPNPPSPPSTSPSYPRSEVHEFFETGLWSGPFTYNLSSIVATNPIPSLPNVYAVYVGEPADYVQLVVRLSTGAIVLDAPPHRSHLIIEWVHITLNTSVTHIIPSHHHRDHAGGVADYIAAGATLVIPEIARNFYGKVNGGNITFSTFAEEQPFEIVDPVADVHFRAFWHDEAPHARDWIYATVTGANNSTKAATAVFVADVWSPGSDGLRWDTGYARQWLDDAVRDGVPRDAVVVGSHGFTGPEGGTTEALESLVGITGYAYPG